MNHKRISTKILVFVLAFSLNFGFITNILLASPLIIDTYFTVTTGFNGEVLKTQIDENNKILVAGDFTEYNGTPVNRIVRLNPDGTIDNTFNVGTGANAKVNTIQLDENNKILIAGDFTEYNGTAINRIARLNPDGTIDPTFNVGTGANHEILDIAIESDNRILIGGRFTEFNDVDVQYFVRIEEDGGLADVEAWSPDEIGIFAWYDAADESVFTLEGHFISQWDDKSGNSHNLIGVHAERPSYGTVTLNGLTGVRFLASSQNVGHELKLEGSFNLDRNNITVFSVQNFITVEPTRRIYRIGGNGQVIDLYAENTTTNQRLIGSYRTPNRPFTGNILNTDPFITSLIISTSAGNDIHQKHYTNGEFTNERIDNNVSVTPNTSTDFSVGSANGVFFSRSGVYEIIILERIPTPEEQQRIEGYLAHKWGLEDNLPGGHLYKDDVPTIINGLKSPNNTVTSIKIDDNDKILIAGDFTEYNGTSQNRIARLNTNGTIDNTFITGTGFNNTVKNAAVCYNERIFVMGDFTEYNGTSANRLVRLNPDGSIDNNFDIGDGLNDTVNTISLCASNRILIAGNFTEYNNQPINRIVRLAIPFELYYNGNGHTEGDAPNSIPNLITDQQVTIEGPNTLAKTGHTFTGWNTQPDGSGITYAEDDIITIENTNIKLYAQWIEEATQATTRRTSTSVATRIANLERIGNTEEANRLRQQYNVGQTNNLNSITPSQLINILINLNIISGDNIQIVQELINNRNNDNQTNTTIDTQNENPIFTRDLYLGLEGDDVTQLQQLLINQNYNIPSGATGFFGRETRTALIQFQQDNNINPAIGYFGPVTRSVLEGE